MKILCVNAGSSSLKFQVFEMPEEKVLISGLFERIGIDGSYTIKVNEEKIKKEKELPNHEIAFNLLIQELIDNNIVKSLDEIVAVGHRVVQGGEYYKNSVIIDDEVISRVEEMSVLAPLHNPAGIIGIKASMSVIPYATNVAVFDTAFHQTMPEENYMYSLPYEWNKEYKIRKYGYHGTSHKYVSERINEILGRKDTKIITCHIGSGASISAIKDGKCINTSMGLTPTVGVMMGTRCGDVDATIITYMMQTLKLTPKEIENIMNKQSGLLGISGVSSDSRDIEAGINNGDPRCILAQKMLVKSIVSYIARYYVELGGCDAIVFTAGLGENSIMTRRDVINSLGALNIKLDEERNNIRGEEKLITTDDSMIPCYIIPTNEELMIAKDSYNLIK